LRLCSEFIHYGRTLPASLAAHRSRAWPRQASRPLCGLSFTLHSATMGSMSECREAQDVRERPYHIPYGSSLTRLLRPRCTYMGLASLSTGSRSHLLPAGSSLTRIPAPAMYLHGPGQSLDRFPVSPFPCRLIAHAHPAPAMYLHPCRQKRAVIATARWLLVSTAYCG
jgi:hypothetical protein